MTTRKQPRRYPRMARVNEVVREAIGDELERLSDPRLGLVTVTGVDVSADLRQATVYYSALGRADKRGTGVVPELEPDQRVSTQAALEAAAPHLRATLGRQVRLKYTPELKFREDPSIATGNRIEAIIREIHRDDDATGGTIGGTTGGTE
jgi:ribosome-binding factor A